MDYDLLLWCSILSSVVVQISVGDDVEPLSENSPVNNMANKTILPNVSNVLVSNSSANAVSTALNNTTNSMTTTEATNSIQQIIGHSFGDMDAGAIYRGLSVIAGVSLLVVVYFVIRAIRLRRKGNRARRYRTLGRQEKHELAPLERDDDDEEEDTMFDLSQHGHR